MKYLDCNNSPISYGDILKCKDKMCDYDNPYSPPEPFFMLVKKDNEDMIYISGMDEFQNVNDWKLKTDKINELKVFQIFAYKAIYEGLIKSA